MSDINLTILHPIILPNPSGHPIRHPLCRSSSGSSSSQWLAPRHFVHHPPTHLPPSFSGPGVKKQRLLPTNPNPVHTEKHISTVCFGPSGRKCCYSFSPADQKKCLIRACATEVLFTTTLRCNNFQIIHRITSCVALDGRPRGDFFLEINQRCVNLW